LPVLPLALLEAVREHDQPGEILEDEDVQQSLPRRLGLSGVVSTQIQRYEQAVTTGTRVSVEELTSLLQLVLRRPDAEPILREAGRRVTRRRMGTEAPLVARVFRRFSTLVYVPIRRAALRLLRGMVGSSRVELGKPLIVRILPAFTADLAINACVLYTGALEELVRIYAGREPAIVHEHCTARGDGVCQWTLVLE